MRLVMADEHHLPGMLACIEAARAYFKEKQIPQWQSNHYPGREDLCADIAKKNAYVVIEADQVIATAAIQFTQDPNYDKIDGAWICDGKYAVIHRIAVLPKWKGQQAAALFVAFAKGKGKTIGCKSLRIDTHCQNIAMIRFIEKCGYRYCGVVVVGDGTKRNAYELPL